MKPDVSHDSLITRIAAEDGGDTPQSIPGKPGDANPDNLKRVHVKSYGCQMNVYDSQRMVDSLGREGFVETADLENADVVILNTCHIRERASEKIYSELGMVKVVKRARLDAGRDTTIVVAGCVAQAEGSEIRRRQPAVDLVVGPQAYHRLPAMLARAAAGGFDIDTEFPVEDKFAVLPAPTSAKIRERGITAFVTVQEGCDKFCSFCVVPYTRGIEVSRPAGAILDEIARLAASGVRDVTLIGQNVNAWHGDGPDGTIWGLERLIAQVATLPGMARIRYMTSHPNDMTDALIAAHRDIPALMPFLHLPVQSGSDRILAAMNRKHDASGYRRTIDAVRAARPDIALSSDFIVGYPGETDADFEATLQLVRDVDFASAYTFKYSARPGTPAAGAEAQVDEAVKAQRLSVLQDLVETQRQAFNQTFVGQRVPVLVERHGRHAGQMAGKSPWLQAVQFDGTAAIGDIVDVDVVRRGPNSLFGRLAGTTAEAA